MDEAGRACFVQKNKFVIGDMIEIMKPDGTNVLSEVKAIFNDEGEEMPAASHASENLHVTMSVLPEPYDIMRMKSKEASE